MEKIVSFLIPAGLAVGLYRLVKAPLGLIWKIAANSACGFLCLWLVNTIQGFTGIAIPINAVTVLVAGFWGLPGMALLAIL